MIGAAAYALLGAALGGWRKAAVWVSLGLVAMYGRNLTNERFVAPAIIQPLFASGTVGPGWSWGVELGAQF